MYRLLIESPFVIGRMVWYCSRFCNCSRFCCVEERSAVEIVRRLSVASRPSPVGPSVRRYCSPAINKELAQYRVLIILSVQVSDIDVNISI